MPGIENNLYPPIIATTMPAFVRTMACRVYFSLSRYNNENDIKNVQVTVVHQNSNLSALSIGEYPTGVMLKHLQMDSNIARDDRYYIEIDTEDLEGNIFDLNEVYKVQLRFTSIKASNPPNGKKLAGWLTDNLQFFSEWSTVCLVKGIEKPQIYLKGFDGAATTLETILFSGQMTDLIGKMYYDNNAMTEKEYMKSYRVKLFLIEDNSLIFDSGDIYTNYYNPNEINYTLPLNLDEATYYNLEISFTTINNYSDSKQYNFMIISNVVEPLQATIAAEAVNEYGCMKISLASELPIIGNITIRRSSSESDFKIWEDVCNFTATTVAPLDYEWHDYTIKSGIWYRYCAQRRDSKGNRGPVINIKWPIMAIFDNMFLTRGDMQLAIKYDPNINTYKRTYVESLTETIGSKYPFIRRNGNINYRQFPISGLITHFCDEDELFLSKDKIYGESKSLYDEYNNTNNITVYQDYIYEREFREKVMDFLYEDNVKLFRSTTEGNILIRLMDINLTPNQILGRMLFSFSATAFEIDDCTSENCQKYGIQNIGEYSELITYQYNKTGQISGEFMGSGENILTLLQEKYATSAADGYISTVKSLNWLRINFETDPYLIRTLPSGSLEPIPYSAVPDEDTVYGYIVFINGRETLVSFRRFYELSDSDTEITSLWFPVKTQVSIDYEVTIEDSEDTKEYTAKSYYSTKISQIWGSFSYHESIYKILYNKHLQRYKDYYEELTSLNKVTIEGIPSTVIYIRDSSDNDYNRHLLNETGVLELYDDDAVITGLYVGGVHLVRFTEYEKFECRDNEFVDTSQSYQNFEDVKNPIKNGVYHIENAQEILDLNDENDRYLAMLTDVIAAKKYIYFLGKWCLFNENTHDVLCPVNIIIDYIFELARGEY